LASLTEWLDMRDARVLWMEEFDLPRDFIVDYSAGSLARLEQVLWELRGGGPGSFGEELPLGAAAYFGEALVGTGAGAWGWDETAEVPLVVPDRRLDLSPVAPIAEVEAAAREPRGRLAMLHGQWARAAARLPDRPVRRITGWLARQEAAFPSWAATHAPGVSWDFTPDSLDALEEVTRRVVSSVEDLIDVAGGFGVPARPAKQGEFRDVAAWYLGEVLRRGLGGFWDNDVNREFLMQCGPGRDKIIPALWLKRVFDQPGYLRRRYDLYAGTDDR
jgi:hypothetical protein